MKTIAAKAVAVLAVLAATVALVGTASASHAHMSLVVPDRTDIGDAAQITATLNSVETEAPLAGVAVVFYTDATFGGVKGQVELGRTVTDANGVAVLTYQPRAAGDHEITVEYFTPGESEPETATIVHHVTGAPQQLTQSSSGIQVPGLNVWVLIGLLATVWGLLLSVAARVIGIAHAGRKEPASPVM